MANVIEKTSLLKNGSRNSFKLEGVKMTRKKFLRRQSISLSGISSWPS